MSAKLYEPCTLCNEQGKIQGINQFGTYVEVDCSCRRTKFQEIGLTTGQLERMHKKADALDRIARLIEAIDLVELGIAADWLKYFGHTEQEAHARAAQEALAGCQLVIRDSAKPLDRKGDATT